MKEIMVVVVSSFLLTGCVTAHRHNSTCLSPGEYNVDFSGPMFNTSPMWTNMTVWVLPCPVVGLEYVTSSSNVYSTAVDPRSQKITAVIKPKQGLERRIYLRTDGTKKLWFLINSRIQTILSILLQILMKTIEFSS